MALSDHPRGSKSIRNVGFAPGIRASIQSIQQQNLLRLVFALRIPRPAHESGNQMLAIKQKGGMLVVRHLDFHRHLPAVGA